MRAQSRDLNVNKHSSTVPAHQHNKSIHKLILEINLYWCVLDDETLLTVFSYFHHFTKSTQLQFAKVTELPCIRTPLRLSLLPSSVFYSSYEQPEGAKMWEELPRCWVKSDQRRKYTLSVNFWSISYSQTVQLRKSWTVEMGDSLSPYARCTSTWNVKIKASQCNTIFFLHVRLIVVGMHSRLFYGWAFVWCHYHGAHWILFQFVTKGNIERRQSTDKVPLYMVLTTENQDGSL